MTAAGGMGTNPGGVAPGRNGGTRVASATPARLCRASAAARAATSAAASPAAATGERVTDQEAAGGGAPAAAVATRSHRKRHGQVRRRMVGVP